MKDQIDSSHKFLYGHRYWPEVKEAVENHAASFDASTKTSLADQILEVGREVSNRLKLDPSLTLGITAVAFMTARQVGIAALKAAPGQVSHRRPARKEVTRASSKRARERRQPGLALVSKNR